MQPCNRIYYSEIYWRFSMFQAAHFSSSGDTNCIYSLWFAYPCGDRPLSRLGGNSPTPPGQRPVTTWVYKPEAVNTVWSSAWTPEHNSIVTQNTQYVCISCVFVVFCLSGRLERGRSLAKGTYQMLMDMTRKVLKCIGLDWPTVTRWMDRFMEKQDVSEMDKYTDRWMVIWMCREI
jgi:hypothetical protein